MMQIPSLPRLRGAGATVVAASALLVLAGCSGAGKVGTSLSSLGGTLTPYRSDVLQGNVVTREQVEALQTGMPREQVRAILGTPLLASAFHADRWDYVFSFRRQGQEPQQRKVTVFFQGDALARVQADALPSEQEFVSSLDRRRKGSEVPPLEATEAELKAFVAKNRPPAEPEKTPPAALPAASYPPLEPR
jgi:outer membrane protein assembly factor BamE